MKASRNKQVNILSDAQNGGMLYSTCIVCVFFVMILYNVISTAFNINSAIIGYLLGPFALLGSLVILGIRNKNNPIAPLFPVKFKLYPSIATALIFVGLTFGLSNLNVYFASWLESLGVTITEPSMPESTPINVILICVTACLLPAIMEETIFRGVIVNSLKNTGTVFTVLIGGLVFALYHMSPTQTIFQFACGAVYTLIIVCGGNFIHTFIIHFLNNLFVVLNHYYFNIQVTPLLTILGLCALVAGIVLLLIKGCPEKANKKLAKTESITFLISSFVGLAIALVLWIQGLFV